MKIKSRTHETRKDIIRHYHRLNIAISLYGMSWTYLWDTEKRLPTLRDYVNRVKFLDNQWICTEYLPRILSDDSKWDTQGNLI